MLDEVYTQALKLISKSDFAVSIDHNNDMGQLMWAIVADNADGFWIHAFPTKEEAVSLCEDCGWKITSISADRTHYYQQFGEE